MRRKIVLLPGPLLSRHQAEEYLDSDVKLPGPNGLAPVAVDWELVNAFRDACSRLKKNADAELPEGEAVNSFRRHVPEVRCGANALTARRQRAAQLNSLLPRPAPSGGSETTERWLNC